MISLSSKKTYEALIDIARINHTFMDQYYDALLVCTNGFIERAVNEGNHEEKTATLSIEVWNFIFEAELKHKNSTGG